MCQIDLGSDLIRSQFVDVGPAARFECLLGSLRSHTGSIAIRLTVSHPFGSHALCCWPVVRNPVLLGSPSHPSASLIQFLRSRERVYADKRGARGGGGG